MILIFILGCLLSTVPWYWRKFKEERRQHLLASQLRQSLQGLTHALRIGVGFTQALAYVSKETEEPLRREWQWLLRSLQIGKSFSQALDELAERIPSKEMRWFVAAVQITQTTGGSLAEVLETLSTTLQAQETLRQKIGALTAQGKVSGGLIGGMPFFILGALYLIAPELVLPLFSSWTGQSMLAAVVVMVAMGGLLIKKIVTIPVD